MRMNIYPNTNCCERENNCGSRDDRCHDNCRPDRRSDNCNDYTRPDKRPSADDYYRPDRRPDRCNDYCGPDRRPDNCGCNHGWHDDCGCNDYYDDCDCGCGGGGGYYPPTGACPTTFAVTTPANGTSVPTSLSTISGTGQPFSRVTVNVDNTTEYIAMVDANGTWSVNVFPAITQIGPHTITASLQNRRCMSPLAVSTFVITDAGVVVPVPTITSPTAGGTFTTPNPVISGTGVAGNTVEVCAVGIACQTTAVDASGNWSMTFLSAIPAGARTFTAVQINPNQQRSAAVTITATGI